MIIIKKFSASRVNPYAAELYVSVFFFIFSKLKLQLQMTKNIHIYEK